MPVVKVPSEQVLGGKFAVFSGRQAKQLKEHLSREKTKLDDANEPSEKAPDEPADEASGD